MKTMMIALLTLFALSACSGGPQGHSKPLPLGNAVQTVEEVVGFYAFSAKDMHVDLDGRGGATLRWQDQLHDKHNKMRWVPRKYRVTAEDRVSTITRSKNGYKLVLSGPKEKTFFIAENEQRAQQLSHALYSIIQNLK